MQTDAHDSGILIVIGGIIAFSKMWFTKLWNALQKHRWFVLVINKVVRNVIFGMMAFTNKKIPTEAITTLLYTET